MSKPFFAARTYYDKNLENSRTANVSTAIIETPTGQHEPGITINVGPKMRLVLTKDDARRITIDLATLLLNKEVN